MDERLTEQQVRDLLLGTKFKSIEDSEDFMDTFLKEFNGNSNRSNNS